MSPYQHYQIARAHHEEIVSRAINPHQSHSGRTAGNWQRGVKHRLLQLVAVLGVCGAAGTAVTVSEAHSHQAFMTQHHVRISAQQVARETRALEAKGYVPTSCIVSGTLMRNYRTGQSVTVKW
jgi:predicted Abi (CAAX) family protease